MSNYNSTHTGAQLDEAIGRVLDGGSIKVQVDTNTADITNLKGRMTTAEGTLSEAVGDVSSLETAVEGNTSDINNLKGRMTTAEGNITTANGRISDLETAVASISPDDKYFLNVNEVNDTTYTLATAITAALGYMQSHNVARKKGFTITYKTGTSGNLGIFETAQYVYNATQNDSNFSNSANWVIQPNKAEIDSAVADTRYKSAILNVNLFNDIDYTLTTAIAKAYDLMGAKRGLIVMFRTSNTGSSQFSYYRYTYVGTLNETNFKNETYWVDWTREMLAGSLIDLALQDDKFADITSTATIASGVKLTNHAEASSGWGGASVATIPVKAKCRYRLLVYQSSQSAGPYERFCFYDSNGTAITPIVTPQDNYTFAVTALSYDIYELTSPDGAVTLKVQYIDNSTFPFAVLEEKAFVRQNAVPLSIPTDLLGFGSNALDISESVELAPLKVEANTVLNPQTGLGTRAGGPSAYYYPNVPMIINGFGSTIGMPAAAFDAEGNIIQWIGELSSIIDTYAYMPIVGAAYIVVIAFPSTSNYEHRVLSAKIPQCVTPPMHENNPIPTKHGLKVLVLGNSFTQDTLIYLPNILRQANITDCIVAGGCGAGMAFDDWMADINVTSRRTDYTYNVSTNGGDIVQYGGYSVDALLDREDWDIIVLQERSYKADSICFFYPYMEQFMNYIKNRLKNRKLCFLYNMIWGTSSTYDNASKQQYNNIINTTKRMIAMSGLNHVIPVGTGIQYGRQSVVSTPSNWTRDGLHLDMGVGRYVAAATFFQYLFGYVYDVDIRDYASFSTSEGTAVGISNIHILNQCAADAVNNRFMLETIS